MRARACAETIAHPHQWERVRVHARFIRSLPRLLLAAAASADRPQVRNKKNTRARVCVHAPHVNALERRQKNTA